MRYGCGGLCRGACNRRLVFAERFTSVTRIPTIEPSAQTAWVRICATLTFVFAVCSQAGGIAVWEDQVQVQRQRLGVPDPESSSPTSGTAPNSVHGSAGPRSSQRATPAPPHFASQPTTAPESRRQPLRTQRSEPVTTFQPHLSEDEDTSSRRAPSIAPVSPVRSSVRVPQAPSHSSRHTPATAGSSAPDTDTGNDTEVTEHATDDDYQSITRRSRRLPPPQAPAPAPIPSKSKGKSRMPGSFTDSTPSSGRTSAGTTGHIRAWVREVRLHS